MTDNPLPDDRPVWECGECGYNNLTVAPTLHAPDCRFGATQPDDINAEGSPSDDFDVIVDEFATAMKARLREKARIGWGTGWQDPTFTDEDVAKRLVRAVAHLKNALRLDTPNVYAEVRKRAADVANLALMAADPARLGKR